jgi:hypothetical protein
MEGGDGMAHLTGCYSAEVIQVIKTETAIGNGTREAPCRILTQYWDFDGNLLASVDPVASGLVSE